MCVYPTDTRTFYCLSRQNLLQYSRKDVKPMPSSVRFWGMLALAVGAMIAYLMACFRAEAPKKGTVEWILSYDKPKFSLLALGSPLNKRDALAAVGAFFLQIAVYFVFVLISFARGGVINARFWQDFLPLLAAAGGCGVVLYLAAKRLTGSCTASLMAVLVLAGELNHDPCLSLLVLAAFLCLVCYLGREAERLSFDVVLLMGVFAAVSAFFCPPLIVLVLGILLMMLVDGAVRLKQDQQGFWPLPVSLLLFSLGFALALSCAVCAEYLLKNLDLWTAVQNGSFFLALLSCVEGLFCFSLPNALTLGALFLQAPSLIFAVGALPFLLFSILSRRDPGALVLLIWNLFLLAVSIFFGVPSLCVLAGALSCSYLSARMFARESLVPGTVGAAFLVAATYALSLCIYF